MLELNVRPPALRPGIVRRRSVLERARAASDARLVTLIAPAGYGKTTLMAQLMADQVLPSAWLSLDASDNDPAVLLRALVDTVAVAALIERSFADQPLTGSDQVLPHGVPNLVGELARNTDGGVLFVDQVDSLRTRSARDTLAAFLISAPPGLKVFLAGRSAAGLPIPLLRSRGPILELSANDLRMDEDEAAQLLDALGVEMELADLVDRSEGWPAGMYLMALASQAGAPVPPTIEIRGDDVFLADYIRQEVLGRLSSARMRFLTRTSILTRMSGPLCDFVLESEGSARTLTHLEESNLMVVPLDRTRTWYRYHSLLQDFLTSELLRREPDVVGHLHSRAATWLEQNGYPEMAIEHARAAGEGDRLAIMVSKAARITYARGRVETLARWLDWLEHAGTIVQFPDLAAVGALTRSLEGDVGGADRLASYAYRRADGGLVSDPELSPVAMMLRSLQAPQGPEQALLDSRSASESFAGPSEWLHVAIGAEALALLALDEDESADALLTAAVALSDALEARPFTTFGLGCRTVLAFERDDEELAERLITRALELIASVGLERYVTSALPFSLAARLAVRRGQIEEARGLMGNAAALRPRLTGALPILSVITLHEMAKSFIELADMAGARRVTREASDVLAVRPRLGSLVSDHDQLKKRLATLPAGSVGPSSLTSAELRLLPLLVTHLTYPEIGERLFVSRHTVKTQAMSIYRKLGVSSRTEAVEKARSIGLLGV